MTTPATYFINFSIPSLSDPSSCGLSGSSQLRLREEATDKICWEIMWIVSSLNKYGRIIIKIEMSVNYFRDVQPTNVTGMHHKFEWNAPFPATFGDDQLVDPSSSDFGPGFVAPTIPSKLANESVSSPPKSHDPMTNASVGITNLVTKTLISHPCTVLRRQCQVHQFARSLHLTPFTLIPVVYKIVSCEGLLTLWKGAIGSGVLWCLSIAGEILIADIFGLPRYYIKHGSVKKYCHHLILKVLTAACMTPFIVSSFIETVRSESGLCDDLRVMDVVTNGISRLRLDFVGPRDNSKRISLLYLIMPTASLFTSHYFITINIYDWIYVLARRYVNRKPLHEKTVFHQYFPQIFATLTSQMLADFILYPFETVTHRLYIQGTRTLIDNLDSGITAISITAKYVGFFDCFKTIINRESFWSLYAGVGALGLQYILHLCLLRFIRTVVKYGNRAINVQQQEAIVKTNTSSHRLMPLQFDSASSGNVTTDLSTPLTQNISLDSKAGYPAFGQTISTFGRTSPPLLASSMSNLFAHWPSPLYPKTSTNQ
ncbi:Mitochondrial outer membrane protein [Dirofilaria immitis]